MALCREYRELVASDVSASKCIVEIPCPVSGPWPAVQRVSRRPPAGEPLRVGFAGRLAAEKGLDLLLDALAQLAASGVALRLDLAGDGPLRRSLEARAAESGLAASVRFLGWLERQELGDFYRSIDLFCLPSTSENQGIAAQEALLRGTPVVAARIGGLADTIRPGLDGELSAAGDSSSLAAALERARARLLAEGYRVPDPEWMERFSPDAHRRALGALIVNLVAPLRVTGEDGE